MMYTDIYTWLSIIKKFISNIIHRGIKAYVHDVDQQVQMAPTTSQRNHHRDWLNKPSDSKSSLKHCSKIIWLEDGLYMREQIMQYIHKKGNAFVWRNRLGTSYKSLLSILIEAFNTRHFVSHWPQRLGIYGGGFVSLCWAQCFPLQTTTKK